MKFKRRVFPARRGLKGLHVWKQRAAVRLRREKKSEGPEKVKTWNIRTYLIKKSLSERTM